jgi:hypothetical protein
VSATQAAVPPGLRRRWGRSLAGVHLFAEALQVWPDGVISDRIHRAELALLAGQPRRALELLEHAGPVLPGSPEHLCGRILAAGARTLAGDLPALKELLTDVVKLPPSPALSRLVALSAASSGQLGVAGTAAWGALRDGCGDHRLLAIAAAAAAADGRYADAVVLAEEAERVRRPAAQDAAETTVNLLRHVGHAAAAIGLAALGAHAWSLPAERRAVWDAMATTLRPRGFALDPPVEHLVRAQKRLRRRDRRRALVGGRALGRRRRLRELERLGRAAREDLTCHCEGIVAWLGPEARHYVGNHLQLAPGTQPFAPPARLLRCPSTGATFLDLPDRPATVSVVTKEPREDDATTAR